MQNAPKSLRLQIGIFGRTNVGKSSFLNLVAGQDIAITSPIPGTTTDIVEKTMELLPVGPVVFLDTAGVDDSSMLSELRLQKTNKIFDRADVGLLILEPNVWTEFEEKISARAAAKSIPLILVINKTDLGQPSEKFMQKIKEKTERVILASSLTRLRRDAQVNELKKFLLEIVPEDFLKTPALIADLLPQQGLAILIIPIDFEAPKGRIILPQVQAIRDLLDYDQMSLVVKESEYGEALKKLKNPPDLVVCDSQVVDKMVAQTPEGVKCTTFSILFSRFKGDLEEMTRGALMIDTLRPGDKILVAESCSHHAIEDDIGRVKMPKWFREYLGFDLQIDVTAGRDFPENLKDYKLVVQCGSCMLTRRETLVRIRRAVEQGVAVTNYGLAISHLKGVLGRVLEPFQIKINSGHSCAGRNVGSGTPRTDFSKKAGRGRSEAGISSGGGVPLPGSSRGQHED